MFLSYFHTLFIIITIFGHYSNGSSITLLTTPSLLCVQDTVQFNCSLGAGPTYTVLQAGLSINESDPCPPPSQIDSNTLSGVDTTRYMFTSLGLSQPTPPGLYTISPFLLIDSVTRFSCCAPVDMGSTEYTDTISLLLAAPPSAPTSVSISSSYDSATSCNGTITLTWLEVASDRTVTSYEVLLNGTVDGTTGNTTYTTGILNLLEYYATYTVMATSCAGSSLASLTVSFEPLTPASPSAASISISTTYDSPTSCNGTITLTWLSVASDRAVTSYILFLTTNTTVSLFPTPGINNYTTGTLDLLSHYATYTVTAISCAGSSTSPPVRFIPITPGLPTAAIVSLSSAYDSAASCNGTITLTWQAVASDRVVTSYEVFLNGTLSIGTTVPTPNMNNFTTNIMNLLEHSAAYYVKATSCAGSNTSAPVIFTPLTPAPPSDANINMTTTYDSATSCNGTITLTWLAVTSDRALTRYEVLLNGTNPIPLFPNTSTNTYTTSSMSLATFNGRYTVRAVSCAGSSASNSLVFTSPMPPTAPHLQVTTTILNNCSILLNMMWNLSTSDRAVTHYLVMRDNTVIATLSNNITYYGTLLTSLIAYNYSVSAANCAGSTQSNSIAITDPFAYTVATTSTPASSSTNLFTTNTTSLSSTSSLSLTYISDTQTITPTTTISQSTSSIPTDNTISSNTNSQSTPNTTPTGNTVVDLLNDCNAFLYAFIITLLLLLLSIIVIVIGIIYIIHLLRRIKALSTKNNDNNNNNNRDNNIIEGNSVHTNNFIAMNELDNPDKNKHYYSEMVDIATNNNTDYVINDLDNPDINKHLYSDMESIANNTDEHYVVNEFDSSDKNKHYYSEMAPITTTINTEGHYVINDFEDSNNIQHYNSRITSTNAADSNTTISELDAPGKTKHYYVEMAPITTTNANKNSDATKNDNSEGIDRSRYENVFSNKLK